MNLLESFENWIDIEYENYQRLKIEFVDNN